MIHEVLLKGEQNAQTGNALCALLGISIRDVTAIIEKERRAGFPICASTGGLPGYFLAENKEEMERYCRSLQKRAGEIHKTRRACLATIDQLPE